MWYYERRIRKVWIRSGWVAAIPVGYWEIKNNNSWYKYSGPLITRFGVEGEKKFWIIENSIYRGSTVL